MRVAVLCSGQGGQHRAMFRLTGEAAAASPVFDAAAAVMGVDPRRFVREAPDEALFGNRAGQILCCTQALAAWAMLGLPDVVLAGYSVGELAAWGCAGYFDVAQTLRLAGERASAMDRAAPAGAGMAAFTGLQRAALERLLAGRASIAIVNGADSFVAGGPGAALDACVADAARAGARAQRLRVSVASHIAAMAPAADAFASVLEGENLQPGRDRVRLLRGIDAETVRDRRAGVGALAAQIAREIDWAGCVQACREAGASLFLELGPGGSLARMTGEAGARSLEDFRTGDGVSEWLARAG